MKNKTELGLEIKKVFDELGRFVIPAKSGSLEDRLEQIGSVLLLRQEPYYLLITASHVIDMIITESIYLSSSDKLIAIKKAAFIKDKDLNLDMCAAYFNKSMRDAFENRSYWEYANINLTPELDEFAIVIGYPNSKNKIKRKNIARLTSFGFLMKISRVQDGEIRLKIPNDYIVTNTDGTKSNLMDLNGISGGGVWIVGKKGVLLYGIVVEQIRNEVICLSISHLSTIQKNVG